MSMTIILDQEQKDRLDFLIKSNRYPDAYRYAQDIVNLNGGDARTANWLRIAADINEGDPYDFHSNFVRSSTIEAAKDQGMILTDQQFQLASDHLAREVINGFVTSGVIKHVDNIISQDVKSVVNELGLTPEGWAGTMSGDWYLPIGLNLDDASNGGNFYSYLAKNWQERGIDTFFEEKLLWGDILENNVVGFGNAFGKEIVEIGIDLWDIVSNYNDQNESNYSVEDFKYYIKQSLEEKLQQSLTDEAFNDILEKGQFFDLSKYSNAVKDIANQNSGGINNINISVKQDAKFHLVASGDTLSSIAAKYGVSVEYLKDINAIDNPDLIIAGSNLKLRESQDLTRITINDESYQISDGDKTLLLEKSGIISSDAIYVDSEGNNISIDEAFYTIASEGNTLTILKEGIKSQAKDGSYYEVNALISQIDSAFDATADFIISRVEKAGEILVRTIKSDNYVDSLIGNVLSDIILGENDPKQIAKNLAEGQLKNLAAAVLDDTLRNALAETGLSQSVINNLAGEQPSGYITNSVGSAVAVDSAGNPLPPSIQGTVYTAIINFAISASDSSGWSSEEYAQAAKIAIVSAVVSAVVTAVITPFLGPLGPVLGPVIGAVISAIVVVPLVNYVDNQYKVFEDAFHIVRDLTKDLLTDPINTLEDFSLEDFLNNSKELAIDYFENVGKLGRDILIGTYNLFGGHYGQRFAAGEYGDPSQIINQLYQVRQKADGSGLEIYGVGREGVTLRASQNGVDDIYGSAKSDVLVGNNQDNIIIGSSGNDNGVDNDMIEGKGGDDILLGKEGHDYIDGGDGDDQIDGGVGNDRLIGGNGDDIIIGDEGDDVIEGGNGDDQIDSGSGDDIIYAGAGNDKIISGTGNDQIDAGEGDDVIFSEYGDDLIRAGLGNDTIDSGDGNDEVYGQEGNDNINSGLGDDIVFAGSGVDTINAGLGNDIIDAGEDDDLVLASLGNDIIYGNSGNDDLYGEIGNDYIMGGVGDDEIGGGEGDDILIGDIGNDKLDGGSGDDLFIHNLGDGNSEITDESGLDIIRVFGVANQNDITFVKNGDDLEITFSEDAGDKITVKDQFLGSDVRIESLRIDNNKEIDLTSLSFDVNQNAIYSTNYYSDAIDESELIEKYKDILQDSDNEIIYNPYSSWYNNNYDTNVLSQEIDYERYNEVQIRSYKKKRSAFGGHYNVYYKYYEKNLGGTFGNDKIVGSWWSENIWGGKGNDYLFGNDGNDNIFGGDDHDLIYLGSGNDAGYGQNGFDKIYGGQGNDTIEGNADNDTLYGEAGNDVLFGRSGDDLAFGGKGNDFIKGGTGHDILFGGDDSDNIEGEDGNDYLLGERGDDIISGGKGDDIIVGGAGSDILNGNAGNDTIKGGEGHDIIDGGAGNDIINAGSGNDMIIDSTGNDQITFGDGRDILMVNTANGGTKTITDFNKNEDRIVLKDVTKSFNNLENNLTQEGNNVRFSYNNYNLILENTQITDLNPNNFITSIIGDELDNILNGDEYANAIFGLGGDDILNGNGGNDLLWGGNGADQLYGNAGDDILYYNIDSYWKGSRQVAGKWNVINRTPSTINSYSGDLADLTGNTASRDLFDGGDGDDILIMSEQADTILLDSALNKVTQFWNRVSYEENSENGFGGAPISIETIYAFGGDDIINLSSNTNTYGDVRIYGDAGNDTIWTNIGNDSLFGGDGNDNLQSGAGDDLVYGGYGNDIIYGQGGNDILYGDEGNDTIYGDLGNDILSGGAGVDLLQGGEGDDSYVFNIGDGNDKFYDNGGSNDKIKFGGGIAREDFIFNRLGNDLKINFQNNSNDSILVQNFFGGNMIEFFEFADGTNINIASSNYYGNLLANVSDSEYLYGANSNDRINGFVGDDLIYGLDGDDNLYGDEGNDYLNAGVGSDRLFGGDGNDILEGGLGNDSLRGDLGDDILDGGDGDDYLDGGEGNDALIDGKGNDILRGGLGKDRFEITKNSNDVDVIEDFTLGQDRIDVSKLYDFIDMSELVLEQDGDDTLIKFSENNQTIRLKNINKDDLSSDDFYFKKYYQEIINEAQSINFYNSANWQNSANAYNDGIDNTIWGFYGNKSGSYLNDKLVGKGGGQTIKGNGGHDIIWAEGGHIWVQGGEDKLYGGAGNDMITGEKYNDYIDGGTGHDRISGGGLNGRVYVDDDELHGREGNDDVYGEYGSDILYGDEGHDYLNGGEGNDYLYGGSGNDVLVGGTGDGQYWQLDDDHMYGGEGNDLMKGENGNDYLEGGKGKDQLYGQVGNDELYGNEDMDYLNGGEGNDILNGGDGEDYLDGGEGDDVLIDGSGNDILRGGLGRDRFEITKNSNDIDVIEDFTLGQDRIDLRNLYDLIDMRELVLEQDGVDTLIKFSSNNQTIRLKNINKDDLSDNDFYFKKYYQEIVNEAQSVNFSNSVHWRTSDNAYNVTLKHYSWGFSGNRNGGSTNDKMVGNGSGQIIHGLEGHDQIWAQGGNDYIYGDQGNDDLRGEAGDDHVYGGAGHDYMSGGGANGLTYNDNDYLYGGEGNDEISGEGGTDYLYGDEGHDSIRGGEGNDYLYGGKGNDIIIGGTGNGHYWQTDDDHMYGGEGNDIMKGEAGNDYMEGGTGKDTLYGKVGNDELYGNEDMDYLSGGEGDDILDGGDGEDYLIGGDGDDVLIDGKGNDILRGGLGRDRFEITKNSNDIDVIEDFTLGQDRIDLRNLYDLIDMSQLVLKQDGVDTLIKFSSNNQTIRLKNVNKDDLSDNDFYFKKYYQEIVDEAQSINFNNSVRWRTSDNAYNVTLKQYPWAFNGNKSGGATNDKMVGNDSSQIIKGLQGHDQIWASGGNDSIYGNQGNDHLTGGHGNDYVYGGEGHDYMSGGGANGLTYNDNDYLYGGDGNDEIYGEGGKDYLYGGNGHDSIRGGDGNDYLYGEDGNDIIIGGTGNGHYWQIDDDHMYGGAGNDLMKGENGNDYMSGGLGKDKLYGQVGNDELYGNEDMDYLKGGEGNDMLDGGDGEDYLGGGEGDDVLIGGNGNDILSGGIGIDLLNGGTGADSFNFSSLEDSSINAIDEIEDFEQGVDKINLSQIEKDLSFESFEFLVENGHTIVKDKSSDFAIDIQGQFIMNEDDFIF